MAIELIYILYLDIKKYKIPNIAIVFNIILFITLCIVKKTLPLYAISASFAVTLVGIVLFSIGILGAGDSKLIASLILVLPVEIVRMFLLNILVITSIYGVVFIFIKLGPRSVLEGLMTSSLIKKVRSIEGLPYAPAIFLTWISLFPEIISKIL